ncbi:calcium channel-like protein [Dothistroma septosporum NZE10]|uniref:Calcium channel-like protein n=1 Tax=Dothistroma septosporum (strain NZE10 / CBS 128990) TaxID=675120 RepID=N1PXN4_DOTSN|nr:calcium channel-like protein [Dothistroma septosporum NZE10]
MLCQCPKLTPLQTRLLASVTALALLGLVYWSLSNPHFAYAAELPIDGSGQLRAGEDHNWHRIHDDESSEDEHELEELETRDEYHAVVPRQTAAATSQIAENNAGTSGEIAPGNTTIWVYPNKLLIANHTEIGAGLPSQLSGKRVVAQEHLELRKRDEDGDAHLERRQDATTIYISANTCRQPIWSGSGTQDIPAPQLTLYVSNVAGNKKLGPDGVSQTEYPFDGGFVNATIDAASGTWHMAVSAPELDSNFTGSWSYDLAVSIDDYFYAANTTDPFLYLVDTDSNAALMVTDNLTQANPSSPEFQQWMNLSAPFTLFALNANFTGLMGLENSFCGLQTFVSNNSQIMSNKDDLEGVSDHVQMGMITRGLGNKPKQQFYATGLNSSSQYRAFLAMDGNSTASGNGVVGGGGKVWGTGVDFTTKSDGNCQLLFNLTFCNEVAYAAPSNPSNEAYKNYSAFQEFYDNYTTTWYAPFNYTLAQIPCNTTSDAQYSLAKNCNHCAAAYKEWLCAVSIPRCEDFSNNATFLQPRNVAQPFYNSTSLPDDFLSSTYIAMSDAPTIQGTTAFIQTYNSSFATNRSRNANIDQYIMPGPYKEVLPCEDLCYSLMQSCPASMNFACPYPGRGLEASYGRRTGDGQVTCSYLGAVYYLNGATSFGGVLRKAVAVAVVTAMVMVST